MARNCPGSSGPVLNEGCAAVQQNNACRVRWTTPHRIAAVRRQNRIPLALLTIFSALAAAPRITEAGADITAFSGMHCPARPSRAFLHGICLLPRAAAGKAAGVKPRNKPFHHGGARAMSAQAPERCDCAYYFG
eukprot:321130-Rhodomonas_salina.3